MQHRAAKQVKFTSIEDRFTKLPLSVPQALTHHATQFECEASHTQPNQPTVSISPP